jgi:dipeptidyl aminopeptidase/acylaminoacyl peptidase
LGVENFVWSPNGNTLAYFTQQPDDLKNLRESQQRGFDAVNYDTPQFPHAIWLFDLQTRINEKIYTGDFGIREIAFSPDGEMLVFSTNYSGLAADANFDLWILSPGSRQAFPFTQFPGEETNPQFSPDGQQIAFLGSLDALFKFPQTDLFLAPLSGGPPQNLTAAFDFPVTEFLWHGTQLCFLAQEKTGQHPFEIDLPSGKIKPLLKKNPGDWFSELTGTAQNTPLFLLGESATRLPEIFRLDAAGEFTAISHFSDTLKIFRMRLPEKITWSAPGGKVIEGWFYKPLAGAPPYPTIVALHGGPFSAFRNLLVQNEYLQLYAQHGYAVFAPNPSGSSGYGDAFAREIINQIGKLDSPQILAGLEHLIAQGLVDSNRVGIVGGSYGGYLVNWIISQTNRFRAAVSLYGIFDLTHDWGSSSQPIWQRIYLSEYYWQNSNRYRELSPATFVTQIRTPLLLLHGENDLITDLSNSKQAYRALKTLGRDVELVIYPRENHGIQREPKHEIDKIRRILGWFDRHLR